MSPVEKARALQVVQTALDEIEPLEGADVATLNAYCTSLANAYSLLANLRGDSRSTASEKEIWESERTLIEARHGRVYPRLTALKEAAK